MMYRYASSIAMPIDLELASIKTQSSRASRQESRATQQHAARDSTALLTRAAACCVSSLDKGCVSACRLFAVSLPSLCRRF